MEHYSNHNTTAQCHSRRKSSAKDRFVQSIEHPVARAKWRQRQFSPRMKSKRKVIREGMAIFDCQQKGEVVQQAVTNRNPEHVQRDKTQRFKSGQVATYPTSVFVAKAKNAKQNNGWVQGLDVKTTAPPTEAIARSL